MICTNTILYAEDDENYARLLECTLKEGCFQHSLQIVTDGAKAISYLKGEGKYSDRIKFPMPNVVLADLKMPNVNGFELLHWIRQMSSCPQIPVVVLTASDEVKEIQKAYSMGANSFLIKPAHLEDLKELLKMLDGYWTKFNYLGNSSRPSQRTYSS
jgi:CheY-like chemotaxis protein